MEKQLRVAGLLIGKKESKGFPGKNILPILGSPLCEYPLIAATKSTYINKVYVSTDCPDIASTATKYSAILIERPPEILDPETLTEDVLIHAYETITCEHKDKPDMICLLYANGPFLSADLIDKAIQKLASEPEYDSCVGVCRADMFTPIRAKRITSKGEVLPFYDLSVFEGITSQRDAVGNIYFIDLSLQVLRPSCFEGGMQGSQPPFLWLGNKILAFEKDFGFDVDARWQIPIVKAWLEAQGFSDPRTHLYVSL